jgi:hypothetical protein
VHEHDHSAAIASSGCCACIERIALATVQPCAFIFSHLCIAGWETAAITALFQPLEGFIQSWVYTSAAALMCL